MLHEIIHAYPKAVGASVGGVRLGSLRIPDSVARMYVRILAKHPAVRKLRRGNYGVASSGHVQSYGTGSVFQRCTKHFSGVALRLRSETLFRMGRARPSDRRSRIGPGAWARPRGLPGEWL